ncbi:MAG: betaine--homocysteine S-methyltransferase [Pseudomonadota bacterium]
MATSSPLRDLLAQKGRLLADGATGTNLFQLGLSSGEPPELWNVDFPQKIRHLYNSFIDAGSDIILTNSFGGTANRLKLHDADDRVHELNQAAARLATECAAQADKKVLIAGSVGPTGDLFEPIGPLTFDAAVASFTEQIEGLKAGGAEVIWIETMSAEIEMQAAARAAENCDMDYVITGSFDTAGKTMMGLRPSAMPSVIQAADHGHGHSHHHDHHHGVGANCGVGASDLVAAILEMSDASKDGQIIIAKANCGIPVVKGDEVVYTGTPELMAKYVDLALNSGANIVGGCCGTSPEHLKAMRVAMDNYVQGPRPTLQEIEDALGPYVNAVAAQRDAEPAPKRERAGRRRRA